MAVAASAVLGVALGASGGPSVAGTVASGGGALAGWPHASGAKEVRHMVVNTPATNAVCFMSNHPKGLLAWAVSHGYGGREPLPLGKWRAE